MRDEVTILRDLFFAEDHSTIVFKKGWNYEIVGENKESIFIAKDKETGCHEIPKIYKDDIFKYK